MRASLAYATYTDVGGRPVNEDAMGVYSHGRLQCFVLCDGLGGHGMGDVAAAEAVDAFARELESARQAESFLPAAFERAQREILARQAESGARKRMKTTAAALVTDGRSAYIGHIGDSRVYVFSRGKVAGRTLDHSVPQMLALAGEIEESQIRHHPDRNSLLRVLGVAWDRPMYKLMRPVPLWRCQAFLLCSDGFWENIDEESMCRCLAATGTAEEWLRAMTEEVKAGGAGSEMDNNSAIAIRKI